MKMLFETEMMELLDKIMEIKDCYECGGKKILDIISEYGTDIGDYECNAMEDLYSLPELIGQDYLDFNAEPLNDDADEAAGERLVFQTKDMTDYYMLLKKLCRKKVITKAEFDKKKEDLDRIAYSYISQGHYYSFDYYVPCEISFTDSKAMPIRLDVYLDYQYGYSLFSVLCGVVALMARFSEMLTELKEQYCVLKTVKEAA